MLDLDFKTKRTLLFLINDSEAAMESLTFAECQHPDDLGKIVKERERYAKASKALMDFIGPLR